MPRKNPSILILAAGASARMRGADKLLRPVDGTPLLLRAVRAACAVSDRVVVTLPPTSPRRAWLGDSPATLVEMSDRTMSASIRAGVAACGPGAVAIHLADMPEIDAEDFEALFRAWRTCRAPILRAAAADGRPGQPTVFDASLRGSLLRLSGDLGARKIVAAHAVEILRLKGIRALTDLDTPEDWDVWEAKRSCEAGSR